MQVCELERTLGLYFALVDVLNALNFKCTTELRNIGKQFNADTGKELKGNDKHVYNGLMQHLERAQSYYKLFKDIAYVKKCSITTDENKVYENADEITVMEFNIKYSKLMLKCFILLANIFSNSNNVDEAFIKFESYAKLNIHNWKLPKELYDYYDYTK